MSERESAWEDIGGAPESQINKLQELAKLVRTHEKPAGIEAKETRGMKTRRLEEAAERPDYYDEPVELSDAQRELNANKAREIIDRLRAKGE